jgi:hypothetical protein
MVYVPSLERFVGTSFGSTRRSEYIDNKSGVSARLSITAFEIY